MEIVRTQEPRRRQSEILVPAWPRVEWHRGHGTREGEGREGWWSRVREPQQLPVRTIPEHPRSVFPVFPVRTIPEHPKSVLFNVSCENCPRASQVYHFQCFMWELSWSIPSLAFPIQHFNLKTWPDLVATWDTEQKDLSLKPSWGYTER